MFLQGPKVYSIRKRSPIKSTIHDNLVRKFSTFSMWKHAIHNIRGVQLQSMEWKRPFLRSGKGFFIHSDIEEWTKWALWTLSSTFLMFPSQSIKTQESTFYWREMSPLKNSYLSSFFTFASLYFLKEVFVLCI